MSCFKLYTCSTSASEAIVYRKMHLGFSESDILSKHCYFQILRRLAPQYHKGESSQVVCSSRKYVEAYFWNFFQQSERDPIDFKVKCVFGYQEKTFWVLRHRVKRGTEWNFCVINDRIHDSTFLIRLCCSVWKLFLVDTWCINKNCTVHVAEKTANQAQRSQKCSYVYFIRNKSGYLSWRG